MQLHIGLELKPITFKQAKAFTQLYHRHHKSPPGCKFVIGVTYYDELCGVAICGRPVARNSDDGYTLEITRVTTDGTRNACSILYGAARRIAKALGYKRVITFILIEEPGTSLKASGYIETGVSLGGSWSNDKRPRLNYEFSRDHLKGKKRRFEIIFGKKSQ